MDSYQWHETSPGRYERQIDEAELFYTTLAKLYEGSNRIFFAITGHIRLSVKVPDSVSVHEVEARVDTALRRAWALLRYDHPTIASRVEFDQLDMKCRKVYETFGSAGSGSDGINWLKRSFRVVENGQNGLEFCNSDPPVERDFAILFVVKPPAKAHDPEPGVVKRDLVLRSHHDIIDGIGTLILFNNLLSHATALYSSGSYHSDIKFEDEPKNLSPPFRIAAGLPTVPSQEQQDRMKSISAANAANSQNFEVIGVPFKNRTALPGRNQRAAITLTETETAAILSNCKAYEVSVTQAFHAGIVLAVRDMQARKEASRRARYINYCLINLRGRCAAPYNTSQHPASVYHSASGKNLVVDVTIPGESTSAEVIKQSKATDYLDVLKKVRDYYRGVQNDPEHVGMVPLYFSASTPVYPEERCEVPPPNQAPSISISSMGVIDKIIQLEDDDFTFDDPWVTGEELGTGLGVFLGTWRGRLSISAGFNETYHEMSNVVRFLESLKETTSTALEQLSDLLELQGSKIRES